ncbi:DUF3107 domain-containing protein [Rhodococcoides corynebacterioides]|uniref:DUF3107 domain-containing protein n=1 Tax=Rhodococcoides corynebacterioides TaxID=53972 RepID=A0ABS7P0M1_9NOCA|nr:DUF3107 domain-containing protein [Rhodococcus corynebacterioides]MBY6365935.1 DUF3107 domain-containing protein [Rhodococcus corynebacterioides]MBY6408578.1 DUF3107 domain-containing protein [Rhodococcus corynebacterioides]
MEVKIGISDSPRELVINSAQTPEEVEALVSGSFGGEGVLTLTDEKGRKFLVPAAKLAYVEIGPSDSRRVGFSTVTAS